MLQQLTRFRKAWLIALMVFSLGAVQLLQASPLHDHTRDAVSCALCHVPLSDDPAEHDSSLLPVFLISSGTTIRYLALSPSVHNPAPYQSRAPPQSFL